MASRMKISKKALTEWANVKFGTFVSHMTIRRLLKHKTLLTTFDVGHMAHSKGIRKVQCPQVEQATFSWFTTMQEKGPTISDDLFVASSHHLEESRQVTMI